MLWFSLSPLLYYRSLLHAVMTYRWAVGIETVNLDAPVVTVGTPVINAERNESDQPALPCEASQADVQRKRAGRPAHKAKLEANTEKLWSLNEMERTGGEPDVVGHDKKTGEYIFYDCSAESPKGRRNVCYDREGQEAREKQGVHPEGNAIDMAAAMGADRRYDSVFVYHNSAPSFYSGRAFRGSLSV
jgi:hypothetical protein